MTLADIANVRKAIPVWLEVHGSPDLQDCFAPTYVAQFFDQYRFVDVWGNRRLDVGDLWSIYLDLGNRNVSLWQDPFNRYDVNGDGSVTLADVINVRSAIPAWQQLPDTTSHGEDSKLVSAKELVGVYDPAGRAFFDRYGYGAKQP